MLGEQYRALALELEDLVNRVAELKAAVFDAEDPLIGRREAAVEVEDVRQAPPPSR
jgi:hypothetical protein